VADVVDKKDVAPREYFLELKRSRSERHSEVSANAVGSQKRLSLP